MKSFAPMLESLSEWLAKGAAHAKPRKLDLVNARLAPDMYSLAQQVQLACHHARDGVTRLMGKRAPSTPPVQTTIRALQKQIASTVAHLRRVQSRTIDPARDCSIPIDDERVIRMNAATFLRVWALPHFYFHVVTAYGILRHHGVPLGKQDYLAQLGPLIQSRRAA
jgi:hypothetical protein